MFKSLLASYHSADKYITRTMARIGLPILRVSLGLVFFWFGFLKFFPGMSPAEDLAIQTTRMLTFGLVPDSVSIVILAAWESIIGIGLIFGLALRATLFLLFLQMAGTIAPLFLFPQVTFSVLPFVPTLEGQYIIKNIIIISAAIVLGATVRGGRLISDPKYLSH